MSLSRGRPPTDPPAGNAPRAHFPERRNAQPPSSEKQPAKKQMTNEATGLLAIWSTIAPESETDYIHWLTREHVFERVSVLGFQSGRVLKRRGSSPSEYVMLYELDNADVMSNSGYLE